MTAGSRDPGPAPRTTPARSRLAEMYGDALDVSALALAAGDIGHYIDSRPARVSGLSVAKDGRLAINKYHRSRAATRRSEALVPGEDLPVSALRIFRRTRTLRNLWNPTTRQYEAHRESYLPNLNQCVVVPVFALFSTTFSVYERMAWMVLYAEMSQYAAATRGRAVVTGKSAHYLASHSGMCPRKFGQALVTLESKGAIKVRGKGFRRPNTYWLATQENAMWTYPAGSRRSARARIMRLVGANRVEHVDFDAAARSKKPLVPQLAERPKPQPKLPDAPPKPTRDASGVMALGDLTRLAVAHMGPEAVRLMSAEADAVAALRTPAPDAPRRVPTGAFDALSDRLVARLGSEGLRAMEEEAAAAAAVASARPAPAPRRHPLDARGAASAPPPSAGVIHTPFFEPQRSSAREAGSYSDRREDLVQSQPPTVDSAPVLPPGDSGEHRRRKDTPPAAP